MARLRLSLALSTALSKCGSETTAVGSDARGVRKVRSIHASALWAALIQELPIPRSFLRRVHLAYRKKGRASWHIRDATTLLIRPPFAAMGSTRRAATSIRFPRPPAQPATHHPEVPQLLGRCADSRFRTSPIADRSLQFDPQCESNKPAPLRSCLIFHGPPQTHPKPLLTFTANPARSDTYTYYVHVSLSCRNQGRYYLP